MKLGDKIRKEVRKVKSNGKTAVGMSPSRKSSRMVSFESLLESDFIARAEFDPYVDHYSAQPVKITYKDAEGKKRLYTPDFLVYHRKSIAKRFPPVLVEVKYRSDIKKNWIELKPKFLAAARYAKSKRWKFKIMTEVEIKTNYTENIKFLLPYRSIRLSAVLIADTLTTLEYLENCTPSELIVVASSNKEKRKEIINALWHLIATGVIGCNLKDRLHMESDIWHKPDNKLISQKPLLYAKA